MESPAMARDIASICDRGIRLSTFGMTSVSSASLKVREILCRAHRSGSTSPPQPANHLHGAVAERHHHDHGLGFTLRDQVVENDVGPADCGPSAGIVTVAVQQIEHRIRLSSPSDRSPAACRRSSRDHRRRPRTCRSDDELLRAAHRSVPKATTAVREHAPCFPVVSRFGFSSDCRDRASARRRR